MKIVLALFFVCVILSCKEKDGNHCNDKIDNDSLPAWLTAKIEELKKDGYTAQIEELQYSWGSVVFINPCLQCADMYTYYYDLCGNEVCKTGGFAGTNTCPTNYREQSERKLIWKE